METEISNLNLQITVLEEELALVETLQVTSEGIHAEGAGNDQELAEIKEYNISQSIGFECHNENYTMLRICVDIGVYEERCNEIRREIAKLERKRDAALLKLAALRAALAAL